MGLFGIPQMPNDAESLRVRGAYGRVDSADTTRAPQFSLQPARFVSGCFVTGSIKCSHVQPEVAVKAHGATAIVIILLAVIEPAVMVSADV